MDDAPRFAVTALSAAVGALTGVAAGYRVRMVVGRFGIVVPRAGAVASTALLCAAVAALCAHTDAFGTAPPTTRPVAFVLVTGGYVFLAVIGIALAVIDVRLHRLPNALVLPAYPVLAVLLTAASATGAPWGALVRAAAAGGAVFAFFAILRLLRPGAMGGGDVKLAGLVGAALGWIGWTAVVVGVLATFVAGGLFGVALIVTRRATGATSIPFGPFLVTGLWIGAAGGILASA